MRRWRTTGLVLLLCLILVGSIACSPLGDKGEVIQQPTEVVRGDLTFGVSGSGTIDVSSDARIAFGTGGRIDKIYVKEGDRVDQGEALAKLDTDDLELALTQAEVARAQAQLAQTQAQLAVTQAEVALEQAKFNLDRMEDVKEAKDDIEEAEWELKIAEERLKASYKLGDEYESSYWRTQVLLAQAEIAQAQADLAELLAEDEYASLIVDEVKIKVLQVKAAEQSLEQAEQSVTAAEQALKQTDQSLEYAQRQLEKATITAPFAGLIASVDAKEGDIVPSPSFSPSPIFYLVDLSSMELVMTVDEIDIPDVRLNQRVIIELDALPDAEFEGQVTFISSLPSPQAGIVLYEVKITFDVHSGLEPKMGMSADADIIISGRNNILLVPNRAIFEDEQGNTVVKVPVNEQIEERVVVTGISDGFDTEIVSGLSEGETVIVETVTKAG